MGVCRRSAYPRGPRQPETEKGGYARLSMVEYMIEINCQLPDCMFYHRDPKRPGKVFCKHKDKPNYLGQNKCVLYRLDWAKNAPATAQFLKAFNKRKGATDR